jgi:hypothetical protein
MGATHRPGFVTIIMPACLFLMGCTHPTHSAKYRHARKHNSTSYDTLLAWGVILYCLQFTSYYIETWQDFNHYKIKAWFRFFKG